MQSPPILTKREQELLPYLVNGATRSEIAATLDVSDETIKWHTRQLLKKFGVRSVPEGFKRMQEYIRLYSNEGLGFSYVLEKITNVVTLYDNLKDAHLKKTWTINVIRDGEIEFRHLQKVAGKVQNIQINGVPVDSYDKEDDLYIHKAKTKEYHMASSRFLRVFECDYIDVYPENLEYHAMNTGHPVGSLTLRVNFPLNKTPVKTWSEQTFHGRKHPDSEAIFHSTDRFAELTVPDAVFSKRYCIYWQWRP